MSFAKENANPQLFSIENADQYAHTRQAPLNWTKLGSFRQETDRGGRGIFGMTTGSTTVIPISAEDKAILRAIMDSSRSTKNGRGVNLLRKAGLIIPTHSRNVAGPAKATSSSCYSDSSRPVFSVDDNNTTPLPRVEENLSNRNESKISEEEIFDIIRTIQDPEHPNSLEQLGVVSLEQVQLTLASDREGENKRNQDEVAIRFTPTIPHCSMATLIGLCLRVKLHRSLPPTNFKVDVSIEAGTHVSEKAINKQLRDKERVRAALENKHLAGVVDKCIRNGMMMTSD